MKVTLWGTRGSLASPGPETLRYGGNTACVEVRGDGGTTLVLDAGTGIRRLGAAFDHQPRRVDLLLTHLHMDHIQGLGFFAPLLEPDTEVHIWGPASATLGLQERLARYLSPPLFPVPMHELPSCPRLHVVDPGVFELGEFVVQADLVCHPGPTMGYRIAQNGAAMAYLPDHEPALGWRRFPGARDWTSGYALTEGVDLLIHDAQYSEAEYAQHVGWGHSSVQQAMLFAGLAGVRRLMTFHHDPDHTDDEVDRLANEARCRVNCPFDLIGGAEGMSVQL